MDQHLLEDALHHAHLHEADKHSGGECELEELDLSPARTCYYSNHWADSASILQLRKQ